MGAHNVATIATARERAEAVRDGLMAQFREDGYDVAHHWASEIQAALDAPRGGTLKAWMQRHHDEPVDTFQTTLVIARDGKGVIEYDRAQDWAVSARRVDASRATRVLLNGSTREYAGVTALTGSGRVFLGFASWGSDKVQMIVFSA